MLSGYSMKKKSWDLFGKSTTEQSSSLTQRVGKKAKIFRSMVDYALRGDHRHYFSKEDLKNPAATPRCKVCGMLLTEFKVERKYAALNEEIRKKVNK